MKQTQCSDIKMEKVNAWITRETCFDCPKCGSLNVFDTYLEEGFTIKCQSCDTKIKINNVED